VGDLHFNSGKLRLALEAQAKKMRDAVEAEPEESLTPADTDGWATALAHHFAVACPEHRTKDVWREPVKDVNVDVSWDRSRYFSDAYSDLARSFPGYRVVVRTAKFSGRNQTLRKPSTAPWSRAIARLTRVDIQDILSIWPRCWCR
jgi:hypothetical protein